MWTSRLFALVLSLFLATPSWAQEEAAEALVLPGAPTWTQVQKVRQAKQDLTRYVLKGEAESQWSQMLTVQVGPASKLMAQDLAARFFSTVGECETSKTAGPDASNVNGYRSALYRVACSGPKTPPGMSRLPPWLKKHQVSVTKVIWTPSKTYIITRVWHGDQETADHPDRNLGAWRDFFDSIQVCTPTDLRRSCSAWGVSSRSEARALPPVMSGPGACDVLDRITIAPALTSGGNVTHRHLAEVDGAPFFSEPHGEALASKVLDEALIGDQVLVDVGLQKAHRAGVAVDQRRARAESLMLRRFLVANGVASKRIAIALNSGCMWD